MGIVSECLHRSLLAIPRRVGCWGLLTCISISLLASTALAIPANPFPRQATQPDGTVLTIRQGGDEFFNWASVDGVLVQRGPDGVWRYLTAKDGVSQHRAGIDPVPAGAARLTDVPQLRESFLQAQQAKGAFTPKTRPLPKRALGSMTQPILVLLVEFSDRSATTTDAVWTTNFFGTTGKTVRDYYHQISHGAFDFVPVAETAGTSNDGIVRVNVGYAHPNTGATIDTRNQKIVSDALTAADAFVNFAAYDTDSDGGLSSQELHIVTIVAGYEYTASSKSPSVWGHRWVLQGTQPPVTLDNVLVGSFTYDGGYTQQGELHTPQMGQDYPATIGILCHELGHDIGLPDLYDYGYDSNGVGMHCLMAIGSYGAAQGEYDGATPVVASAWCREYLGFITPAVISSDGTYDLVQASDPVASNIIRINTGNPRQYFLIENRQLTGYDAGLYWAFKDSSGAGLDGGVAIWHIDEAIFDNEIESHKMVDLEEANEGLAGGSDLDDMVNYGSRAHYFYTGNVTRFDDTTTPDARLYNGTDSGVVISDVSNSGATMTVTVGGGSSQGFTISGTVRTTSGTGLAGVTLSGLPGDPQTDANGNYTATVPSAWSGTATPILAGYTFTPTSKTYTNLAASVTGEDYVATSGSDDDLYEENDAQGQAKQLQAGKKYFLEGLDEDWFRVDLSKSSLVSVSVSGPEGDLDLFLYSNGEQIGASEGIDSQEFVEAAVPVGEILIQVMPHEGGTSSYELEITVGDIPPEDDAYEDNDLPEQAEPVEAGKAYSLKGFDEDWFEVAVTQRSRVTVNVTGTEGDLDLALWVADNEVDNSANTGTAESAEAVVDGGTVLIQVQPFNNETGSYEMTVAIQPEGQQTGTDDTYEPNNDATQAQDILPGTYDLQGLNEDWFRFSLDEQSDVTISISGETGELDVSLLDAGSTVIDQSTDAGSQGMITTQLEQGVYLIRVYPSNDQTSPYRLVLLATATGQEPPTQPTVPQCGSCGAGVGTGMLLTVISFGGLSAPSRRFLSRCRSRRSR